MQKPKHIRILELLSKQAVLKPINISDFICKEFFKPDPKEENNHPHNDPAVTTLKELEYRQLIVFSDDGFLQINNGEEKPWFDTVKIYINITNDGFDYLQKYDLSRNTIRANKLTVWSFFTTLTLSLLTVMITSLTFKETRQNTKSLDIIEQRIDKLSLQLLQIQLQQTHQQESKTFPVNSSHRH